MTQIFAVASDSQGRRYEIALTVPDDVAGALDTNEARQRLQFMLNRDAQKAAEVMQVADNDRRQAAPRRQRAKDAGPNQIAFAGTDESADLDAKGQVKQMRRAGKAIKGGTR